MLVEIVIGEGIKGNSAYGIRDYSNGSLDISQNANCFWIRKLYLGLELTIFKNTDEGVQLIEMIRDKESLSKIEDFLNTLAFKHATMEELKIRIESSLEEAYEQGQRDKAEQIRNALGIY